MKLSYEQLEEQIKTLELHNLMLHNALEWFVNNDGDMTNDDHDQRKQRCIQLLEATATELSQTKTDIEQLFNGLIHLKSFGGCADNITTHCEECEKIDRLLKNHDKTIT